MGICLVSHEREQQNQENPAEWVCGWHQYRWSSPPLARAMHSFVVLSGPLWAEQQALGWKEEVTALVGAVAGEDPETFSSRGGKSTSIASDHGQRLMAIDNVLTDLAEPHFSEMEVVPASLSAHREQRSRVPKMIQAWRTTAN